MANVRNATHYLLGEDKDHSDKVLAGMMTHYLSSNNKTSTKKRMKKTRKLIYHLENSSTAAGSQLLATAAEAVEENAQRQRTRRINPRQPRAT